MVNLVTYKNPNAMLRDGIASKNIALVREALDRGANPNGSVAEIPFIHYALLYGNAACIKALVRKVDIQALNVRNDSVLMEAIWKVDDDILALIVKRVKIALLEKGFFTGPEDSHLFEVSKPRKIFDLNGFMEQEFYKFRGDFHPCDDLK